MQEAQRKREEIDPEVAGRARWHLIGSLQRNKARAVPGLFDVVESVDSLALARELNKRVNAAGGDPLDVFIQVNTGEEAQKGGVAPADAVTLVREASGLEALRVVGLMCIPPLGREAEESRPHFELLRKLRDEAQRRRVPARPGVVDGHVERLRSRGSRGSDARPHRHGHFRSEGNELSGI